MSSTTPRITLRHVGQEREPVVVIDDATSLLEPLRSLAAKAGFEPAATVDSHYPGLLAPAPVAYLDGLVRFALPLIAAHFGTGPVVPARGNFSLVTTPPADLSPDQCVPHVDAADRMQFAGVHCLSDHLAGNGFFATAPPGSRRPMPIAWPSVASISTPSWPRSGKAVTSPATTIISPRSTG